MQMNGPAADRRAKGFKMAAAIAGATIVGFASASLLLAGPEKLKERTPIAAARALADTDEGRDADAPQDFPPVAWFEILKRTVLMVAKNRLMAEAASVTFFALLAIFPALTAVVSLYGMIADPAAIERLLDLARDVVPAAGISMLGDQLHNLIRNGERGLTAGALFGLLTALWSSNQGSKALFEALNVVYREDEKRSYPHFLVVSFMFTLGAIVFVLLAVTVVVALPALLRRFGFSDIAQVLVQWARWPVILVTVGVFLSSMYRFGPSREDQRWAWVTWGGALAAVSWVAVSFAFSWYVQRFGSFERLYGPLGTVIAFMFWLWLSSLVALCGAQLNSEMEHQTAADTTTGDPLPLGLRGATQADTVA